MDDFDIALRDEAVSRLARWVHTNGPVGIEDFDRAWALVRRDRPDRDPWDCPTTRLLIHRFFEELEQRYEQV